MPRDVQGLFLEVLPPEVRDGGRLPLSYAVLRSLPAGAAPHLPMAACDHHRTVGYLCLPYHKPISRCFGVER